MREPASESSAVVARRWPAEPWLLFGIVGLRLTSALMLGGRPVIGERPYGDVYDALGVALRRGEATLPVAVIGPEGFVMPWGRVTYFGFFPAVPRVLLNAIWPTMSGRWTGLSCLAAALVSVWAARRIVEAALAGHDDLDPRVRLGLRTGVGLVMGLGSPMLGLVCDASLFTEAICWSTALSLVAVAELRVLASRVDGSALGHLALGLCAAAVLNTRVTFAVPLLLAAGIVGVRLLHAGTALPRRARATRLAALGIPLVSGLALHLLYNRLRWGSAFTFIVPDAYALRSLHAEHFARGLFHPRRIPWGALNWLLPRSTFGSASPPFVILGRAMPVPAPAWGGASDPFLPLPLVAPALVAVAAGGFAALRRAGLALRAITAAFGLQVLLLFTYFNIAMRYAAEFLPLLLLLAGLGLERLPREPGARRLALAGITALAALSLAVNLALFG